MPESPSPELVATLERLGLAKADEVARMGRRVARLAKDLPRFDSVWIDMVYAQQNQTEPASEYLQRAIELRPEYPEAINNLGIVYVRKKDYAKAEEQFKKGIQAVPAFDQSYLNLARLYAMQNEKDRARQVLLDLLQLQPHNAAAKQAMEMLQ